MKNVKTRVAAASPPHRAFTHLRQIEAAAHHHGRRRIYFLKCGSCFTAAAAAYLRLESRDRDAASEKQRRERYVAKCVTAAVARHVIRAEQKRLYCFY